jgi:predicted PurR-regulated permease PerM
MSAAARKKPPIVRLPPKSSLELLLSNGARIATLLIGLVAAVFALHAGRFILEPITLGIVLGLMFGPVATFIERRKVPPGLSALVIVIVFVAIVSAFALALAAPVSYWLQRLPQIWQELRVHLSQLKEPLDSLKNARDQLRAVTGGSSVTVSVEEGSAVESVAILAPAVLAQILVFVASLYFFVTTRHRTRAMILKICVNRRLRWRLAHVFRDVEYLVSRYLLSITLINVAQGIAVTLALWLLGVQSPAVWGALAGLLNFVIYVGPAIMAVLLVGVGILSYDTLAGSLMPPAAFLLLHLAESQFVTPTVLGRTLTLNPFVIFLALAFWLWIWGPIGGFVAVPNLLVAYAIGSHILPGMQWGEEAR